MGGVRRGFRLVYPRACGGTANIANIKAVWIGLSPRVRGNLHRGGDVHVGDGSIPARAGEPVITRLIRCRSAVYPRACGGTSAVVVEAKSMTGLSPRVRGNLVICAIQSPLVRSIPARAGEPWCPGFPASPGWVYPRACGGTAGQRVQERRQEGLSPRVRGNPDRPTRRTAGAGSIPARAGEPAPAGIENGGPGVYPRACGGTDRSARSTQRVSGLSPRVRGNPKNPTGTAYAFRSIPARAGEPLARHILLKQPGVYPRACGGTRCERTRPFPPAGLSPRVRGNPQFTDSRCPGHRSIPARAGEPLFVNRPAAS